MLFGLMETDLHAMAVHFPIALLFLSVFADLMALYPPLRASLKPVALVTMLLGAASAAVAVLSGPENTARGVSDIFRIHQNWANYTMWFFLALAAWRLLLLFRRRTLAGAQLAAYLLLAGIGLGMLTYTGHLGGKMVYHEAIGVQRNSQYVVPPAQFRGGPRGQRSGG